MQLCHFIPNIVKKSKTFNNQFSRKWQPPPRFLRPDPLIKFFPRHDIILKLCPLLPSTNKQYVILLMSGL